MEISAAKAPLVAFLMVVLTSEIQNLGNTAFLSKKQMASATGIGPKKASFTSLCFDQKWFLISFYFGVKFPRNAFGIRTFSWAFLEDFILFFPAFEFSSKKRVFACFEITFP